jgi:hypothetical protein
MNCAVEGEEKGTFIHTVLDINATILVQPDLANVQN